MAKPICLVQAAISTRSGYGEHSRDIVRSLIKMDRFDIKIIGTRWGDTAYINLDTDRDREIFKRMLKEPKLPRKPEIFVHITVPNEFIQMGQYNIGITAGIETTHCSAVWLEGMNRMNMVIVPSKHSKEVFDKTNYTHLDDKTKQPIGTLKCNVPIEVLFEGVDTSVFHYESNTLTSVRSELRGVTESFCFLFVGHWLQGELFHDRKDVSGLIKVFLETFKNVPNPPALILKTSLGTYSVADRNECTRRIAIIKKMVATDKPLPNVYLLHGDLTDEEMNGLYNNNKVKAHISFTKGEGFGRPLLEASLSRKPVIAPAWSGQVDFLNKQFSMLLPGQIQKIHPTAVWKDVIVEESSWFYVNYTIASTVMMNLWRDYNKHKQNALKQAMFSEQNFSFNRMHEEFIKILDKHLPKFEVPDEIVATIPKLGSIKLPKLKPMVAPTTTPTEIGGLSAPEGMKSIDLPRPPEEHDIAAPQGKMENPTEIKEEKPNETENSGINSGESAPENV